MANRSMPVTWTADKGRAAPGLALEMPEGFCLDAVNVDFWRARIGSKRPPLLTVDLTSGPTTSIQRLFQFIPASAESAMELWAVEIGGTPGQANVKRLAAGTWSTPTTEVATDDDVANYATATARVLNGKLFLTGSSTGLKVWDRTRLRQVGISKPAAGPTVANTGSGAYAATLRYYRVAFTEQATGVTIRRSELSVSTSFTPSGSGTHARVTKPTTPGGVATHWELYASPDDLSFYLIATSAIATTYVDDAATPSAYAGNQPPVAGDNSVPANWKAIGRDGNRLLGWGSNTSSESQSRFWYTAILGESYIGDEERVPSDHYKDIGEADGDYATAISDNVNGAIYLFKSRHIYKAVPTGDAADPYVVTCVSNVIGAADPTAILQAEDNLGNACVYFSSRYSLWRIGVMGLEEIGANVNDLVAVTTAPLIYNVARRQVWFRKSGNGSALCYTVPTGAWSEFTGAFASAVAAADYSVAPGTSVPTPFVAWCPVATPKLGYYASTASSNLKDEGATFYESYVTLAPKAPFGIGHNVETHDPILVATMTSCELVRVSAYADWRAVSGKTGDVSCLAAPPQTSVTVTAEGARVGHAAVVYYKVGDVSGVAAYPWAIQSLTAVMLRKEGA